MSFLNPMAFFFLLSVPFLVLLYFLKLKRPRHRVPSTLLWQKVIEDMRVNSPFQKLRRSLLLLLQLLILLAAIACLTRPLVRMRPTTGESLIVLLDTSASMSAVEETGRTRLEEAQRRLADFVQHMGKGDEMMLITFNRRATVMCGFTGNRKKLRGAIAAVPAAETPTYVDAALRLAKSACHTRNRPRVLLFSDGSFPEPRDVEMPVQVEYQPIGTPRPNLAITGLDVRRSLNDPRRIDMFVSIENFSDTAFSGNMIVRLDGAQLDSKFFSVAGGEILSQVFQAALPAGGDIEVSLDVEDALACDNRAWKVIPAPARRRVLLVGDRTFFLQRALKAMPHTHATAIAPTDYAPSMADGFDAVLWNGVADTGPPRGNNIYFNCLPGAPGFVAGKPVDGTPILDWEATHPATRFIDFDNLAISSAITYEHPDAALPLLRSTQVPLIAMTRVGSAELCIVAFDPMKSNWPLLVSFPLFLNNCLSHFEDLRNRRMQTNVEVGYPLSLPPGTGVPSVRLPDGRIVRLRKTPTGAFVFAGTDRCGIYRVTRPDGSAYSVSAGLFDRAESGLATVEEPAMGGNKVEVVQLHRQVNREFWKWILGFAGLALLLEWTVYHRRWFV